MEGIANQYKKRFYERKQEEEANKRMLTSGLYEKPKPGEGSSHNFASPTTSTPQLNREKFDTRRMKMEDINSQLPRPNQMSISTLLTDTKPTIKPEPLDIDDEYENQNREYLTNQITIKREAQEQRIREGKFPSHEENLALADLFVKLQLNDGGAESVRSREFILERLEMEQVEYHRRFWVRRDVEPVRSWRQAGSLDD
jgi:hypothetical protein